MRLFLEACASYNYIIHVLIVLRYNKFLIVVVVVVVRFRSLIWLCLFKEYLVGTLIYVVVLYTGKGLLNGEKVCFGVGGGLYSPVFGMDVWQYEIDFFCETVYINPFDYVAHSMYYSLHNEIRLNSRLPSPANLYKVNLPP